MNFDEFKDQFTEDVKQALKDAGIDAMIFACALGKIDTTELSAGLNNLISIKHSTINFGTVIINYLSFQVKTSVYPE